jgi:hypothetical protein
MADQTYSNHARFHPPFHFVLIPLLLLHFLYSAIQLFRFPSMDRLDALVLSVALVLMALLVRINPLKVQDRLIWLEERLRYARVLSNPLACRAERLTPGQIVALRFASDEELPSLIEQVLDTGVTRPADIKKGIRKWRGDSFRV